MSHQHNVLLVSTAKYYSLFGDTDNIEHSFSRVTFSQVYNFVQYFY